MSKGQNIINMVNNTIGHQTLVIEEQSSAHIIKCPIIFHLPKPINSFHGRDEQLAKLDKILMEQKNAVVSGMAGIGKTEIAKQYLFRNRDKFDGNLIWINAETSKDLKKSFSDLWKSLGLFQNDCQDDVQLIVQSVYSFFNNKKAIFVFDNAEDLRSIQMYLPNKETHTSVESYVIITSQNSDWGTEITTVSLDILSNISALEILKSILKQNYNENDKHYLLEILKYFDCFPLAIQIVCHNLNQRFRIASKACGQFSIENYYMKLISQDVEILDLKFPSNSVNLYDRTVYLAVVMTLENINTKALDLICMCSFLNPDYITEYDLNLFESHDVLDESLAVLVDYSLISVEKKYIQCDNKDFRLIRMHRLVQRIIRKYLKRKMTSEDYYNKLLNYTEKEYFESIQLSSNLKHSLENFDEDCNNIYYDKYFNRFAIIYTAFASLSDIYESEDKSKIIYIGNLLLSAAESCNIDVINFLVRAGKVIDPENDPLDYSVHPAIYKWQTTEHLLECLQVLLEGCQANVNIQNVFGRAPLHYAAQKCLPNIVEYLLEHGAQVNLKDNRCQTAIFAVACSESEDDHDIISTAQVIVKHGAKLDIKDYKSRTPSEFARFKKLTKLAEFLESVDTN